MIPCKCDDTCTSEFCAFCHRSEFDCECAPSTLLTDDARALLEQYEHLALIDGTVYVRVMRDSVALIMAALPSVVSDAGVSIYGARFGYDTGLNDVFGFGEWVRVARARLEPLSTAEIQALGL